MRKIVSASAGNGSVSAGVLCLFAVAIGFVAGGLLGSVFQLLANRPLRFETLKAQGAEFVFGAATLVFAGPALLMRNAIRARLIEGRPPQWLAMTTAVSAAWSFFLGLFLLNIYVALRSGGLV